MLTSHELFGFMSPALANDIITFTFDNEKPTYRATLNAVAESRHAADRWSGDRRCLCGAHDF